MSIINLNEAYNNFFNEEVLLEKMTKEEYRRRNFKRKYNYEPDRDSKIPNIGYITDKAGNRIKVDLNNYKTNNLSDRFIYEDDDDPYKKHKRVKYPESYSNEITCKNGNNMSRYYDRIHFGEDFFKNKKRSHRGQGAKATVDHEIGHYLLHRDPGKYAPNNDKQKDFNEYEKNHGNKYHFPVSKANQELDAIRMKYYGDKVPNQSKSEYYPSQDIQDERAKGWNAALNYENLKSSHANPMEFEADRVANNRNPRSGRYHMKDLKRVYHKQEKENAKEANEIRNKSYKKEIKEGKSKAEAKKIADRKRGMAIGNIPIYNTGDYEKDKELNAKANTLKNIRSRNNIDVEQRKKALADSELARNKSYKI